MNKVFKFACAAVVMTGAMAMSSGCKNSSAKANATNSENNQQRRGSAAPDKSGDEELKALLEQTVDKFIQLDYIDPKTGKTMGYNLFVPESYDSSVKYPLLMFIADASTVGKDVTVPLTQGYGGVIWASDRDQAKNPCFILVPQYTKTAVNDNFETSDEVEITIQLLYSITALYNIDLDRIYTTGQSMGGMMSMYFNIAYPDLFAASMFVGCQWDTSKMGGFAKDKFFYIVAAGDEKAPKGMAALRTVLTNEGAKISEGEWSAKLPAEEQDANVRKLLSEANDINFIVFTEGSVMPESGKGNEHMNSFDYAYKLTEVRDWLFRQTKNSK